MASIPLPPKFNSNAVPKVSARIKESSHHYFEMKEADFGEDVNHEIEVWLYEQIRIRKQQYEQMFKNQIPKWRRISEGKPREKEKSFPWPGASNLVYQLVGQEIDNLTARVLGLVYATSPLQYFRYLAKTNDPHRQAEKARILETFFDMCGYEPSQLDLYHHDSLWLTDSARLGTSWAKVRPENRLEVVRVGHTDANMGGVEESLYKGPKVDKLRFESILNDPAANTPEESCILIHIRPLNRKDLEERVFKGWYKEEAVKSILGNPDRHAPSENVKNELRKKGIQETESEKVLAEWDIYECWFPWFSGKKKYRLVYWYHYKSKTVMNRVFNFMPDNDIPFVRTKLNSGDEGMNGKGYAEMLESYQEEISTCKNQRQDATTMGILGINRISPMNKNIDRYFKLYPGAAQPFGKDEFEHIDVGNPAMVGASAENENMMIQQAHDRAGVSPAVAGSGTGSFNKKGQYGSMGTLAVMQDSNTVTNYRQSDFRHARVKLATKLVKMYGAFGHGDQGSMFGLDESLLEEALQDFLGKKVHIPIRAATASANKEVEKQNGILLSQHLMMHQKSVIQMLQAVSNPSIPPPVKDYFTDGIKSLVAMERRLLRDFGYDQPEEFAPEPKLGGQNVAPQNQGGGQPPMAGHVGAPGGNGNPGGQQGMGTPVPGVEGLRGLFEGAAASEGDGAGGR